MHAQKILRRFVSTQMPAVHASRQESLIDAVYAITRGHPLRLSGLARGMAGSGSHKAALKRADRLLGCDRIPAENDCASRAIVAQLVAMQEQLVIAVDWSSSAPGGQFVQLRASAVMPGMGRAITLCQHLYPGDQMGSPDAEEALLLWLKAIIPSQVRVILVTDAGFRRPWFKAVAAMKWAWIGRVRKGGKLHLPQAADWCNPLDCFAKASRKPQRWQDCKITKTFAWPCDLVLHQRPRQGRSRRELPNRNRYRKAVLEAKASHKEPWLLACSQDLRHYRADEIVALYALRMQIEETFRDTKSTTFAMAMETARSRSPERLLGLLMLAMLASFFLWHLGQLAEAEGLHRRYRATTRKTREISLILLGLLLCRENRLPLSPHGIRSLFARLGIRR